MSCSRMKKNPNQPKMPILCNAAIKIHSIPHLLIKDALKTILEFFPIFEIAVESYGG